jgi:AcrR family transcriptional regulator
VNGSPERPTRTRDEARALFRNAILDAAEAIFAEHGFHGARIQDIAARARIAVGTVYNHFAQKDDVLSALLEERSEELFAQLHPLATDPRGFRGRLEARVGRMLAYIEQHRAFFAIATQHGLFVGTAAPGTRVPERTLQRMKKFRGVFRDLVDEGVASGDLEPLGGDALVLFFSGTMRAFILSSLSAPRGDHDVKKQAAMTVELFFHGAARRKPRRAASAGK